VPELPDIAAYIEALEPRLLHQVLERVRLANPFLLRTLDPSPSSAEGRAVRQLRRIGKRIAIGIEGDVWLVLHLMIAGRLHWRPPPPETRRPPEPRRLRFPPWIPHPHRGRHPAPRVLARRPR